jgi:hypothetical protein
MIVTGLVEWSPTSSKVILSLAFAYMSMIMPPSRTDIDFSITNELYVDFLKCKYKAYLKVTGVSGTTSDYHELEVTLKTNFTTRAKQHLLESSPSNHISHCPESLIQALNQKYHII